MLAHQEHGKAARELIAQRGISPEMVEVFQLGAAPDRWDGLLLTIQNKGLRIPVFHEAGLLKQRESGGHYDVFRNRLMFPITDQIGRVVAFGARRINDQDDPKYLNSPETRIFNKSATLYGLHQAAQPIRHQRVAIVTEGYMDTIACHQAGVTNAVATLGTALTSENARILRRLCDTVVLLFDGDEAGQKAAERAVQVFFEEPIDVRIAMLSTQTDAKDPDELLKREGGRAVLDRVLAGAIDPLELLFKRARSSIAGQGLAARTRLLDEFLSRLVELGFGRVDLLRRQLIIKQLASLAGVDWETISTAMNQRLAKSRPRTPEAQALAPMGPARTSRSGPSMTAAEHALGCILCDPALMMSLSEEHAEAIDPERFSDRASRAIAAAVHDLFVHEESPSLQSVLASLDDDDTKRAATAIYAAVEQATEGKVERLHAHWRERIAEAFRELRVRVTPAMATSVGGDDWQAAIARKRESVAAHGADPLALPKPGG
jgi:DNA primase